MDTVIDSWDQSKALHLDNIRFQLIRLEDTIIFHLIERVQFPLNPTIYRPGGVHIPNSDLSLLDWMLYEHERLHSLVRRYQSPDEYPFFPDAVQTPILAPLNYPQLLHPNAVNVNAKLKDCYTQHILPAACARFDRPDRGESAENYGSSAQADVWCLQALSRRIHYGKLVAEAKYRWEPKKFEELIVKEDREGLGRLITDENVEKRVLERLSLKAKTYGVDPGIGMEQTGKINYEAVVNMYKDYVIPLTKEVEIEYLLQRLKQPE